MSLHPVEIPRPEIDSMLQSIDKLRERVEAGEFETIWLIAFSRDGTVIEAERGNPRNKMQRIGQLECLKWDIIEAMDTGKEPGV